MLSRVIPAQFNIPLPEDPNLEQGRHLTLQRVLLVDSETFHDKWTVSDGKIEKRRDPQRGVRRLGVLLTYRLRKPDLRGYTFTAAFSLHPVAPRLGLQIMARGAR
jgi:hypothetical protein